MEWNIKLCGTYKDWNEENSKKIPHIIRTEYLRVFELLSEGQVYGAFFQIKDSFEIVIKLLVLTVLSEILENKELSDESSDIVFKLFEKALSLGDWETICRLLINKSQYAEINKLIDAISKIYSKYNITKWRNDYIGHGALPNSDSEYYIKDINEKLRILHSYFEEHLMNYEIMEYKIINNILNFQYKNSLIFDFKFFAKYENEKIFLFDSYNSLKKKSAFLNYSDGVKFEGQSKEIVSLVERLQFDNDKRLFISNFEDEVFSVIEDNIIKEISKIDDFIRPEFIISEINRFIDENDKGVFLLQMEKGMGKSILSNALDQHSLNKIKIKDSVVRGYYVNDTYKSSKSTFVSEINDLFRVDKEGKILYRGNIPYIDVSNSNPKSQFSKLLSFYRNKNYNDSGKEKLIFFVDGLDEIVPQKDGSIFEYLPSELDLEKNVYVIYTSRTNRELENSFFGLNNISKISYTTNLEVSSDSPENKEILVNFLKKKYKGLSKEKIDQYINMSLSTFQYLKRICNALDSSREPKNIYTDEYYEEEISNLYNKFGYKCFNRIIDILLLLSIYHEPLNINVISNLLTDEKANFELLFLIIHLKTLLYSERTIHGNCIQILDPGLNLFLIDKFSKNVTKISNNVLSKSLKILSEQNYDITDTSIYTLSNLNTVLQYSDFKVGDFTHEEVLRRLFEIEISLSRYDLGSLKRVSKLQSQISSILDSLVNCGEKYNIYQAILASNQAEVDDLLGFTNKASIGFYESVRKLNKVRIEDFPFSMLLSSRTYVKYALLCIKTNENVKAIMSLDNALKLYQGLEKAKLWKPCCEDYLYIYNNKGIAYQNLKQYSNAKCC
jgi:hypothetical protein